MLYILAVLLMLVFFLPDLIGPIPAVLCGSVVIGFSFYIYNLWCREESDDSAEPGSIGSQEDRPGLALKDKIQPTQEDGEHHAA